REAFLAVVGRTHADTDFPTRTDVGLGEWCLPVLRVHPLHDVLWVGVRLPDEVSRRLEQARERERPTGDTRGGTARRGPGEELVKLVETLVHPFGDAQLQQILVIGDRLSGLLHGELRLLPLVLEEDGDEERWRHGLLAREREHETLVRHDLAEQSFAYEHRAIRSLHVAAEDAARTRIDLAPRRGEVLRWEPLPDLLRIGPRLVDDLARRFEDSV